MGLYLEIVRSVAPAPFARKVPKPVASAATHSGSVVRERIKDKDGRTIAVRWVSGIIGDMWMTFDRATALRCGLVRPGALPVFYLATDDVEFFKAATPEGLVRQAEFKKAFLSPKMQ